VPKTIVPRELSLQDSDKKPKKVTKDATKQTPARKVGEYVKEALKLFGPEDATRSARLAVKALKTLMDQYKIDNNGLRFDLLPEGHDGYPSFGPRSKKAPVYQLYVPLPFVQ
jgi:hypothetical protein